MTDDLALRIAKLVAELGQLRQHVRSIPTNAQVDLMKPMFTAEDAENALSLTLGLLTEVATTPARAMLDSILSISGALSVIHRDARVRRVTRSEVLRMIADLADREDASIDRAEALAERLLAAMPKVPKPDDGGLN
jgi:hypothetical protein